MPVQFNDEFASLTLRAVLPALLVAVVDYATGKQFEVAALYVAVVMYASWVGGVKFGLLAAAVSASAIIFLGLYQGFPYDSTFYFIVNVVNKVFILAAVALAVSRARRNHVEAIGYARTDPLTNLANRRAFEERLVLECHRRNRTGAKIACAYIDVDDFKTVNDTLGHEIGDAVLVAVAQTVTGHLRSTDLAARLGGDEFSVLLPGTGRDEAMTVIGRIRDGLLEAMKDQNWTVTFSIGLAIVEDSHAAPADLLAQADRLMYEAKRGGKNRIAA
jgi:diguanylate cyclase (GGDEF)-like protein